MCVYSILYCKCTYIICIIYNYICKPLRSLYRDMVPIFSPQTRAHRVTVIPIIKSLLCFSTPNASSITAKDQGQGY